jgi:hypothetical protein
MDDIIVTIESMRTTFEPQIKKMLDHEKQRKACKSANRKKRKELKKKWQSLNQ